MRTPSPRGAEPKGLMTRLPWPFRRAEPAPFWKDAAEMRRLAERAIQHGEFRYGHGYSPQNCDVSERTGDGTPVGRCWHYLHEGRYCERHGDVTIIPTKDGRLLS